MPNASHFTKLEKTFVPALKTTASGLKNMSRLLRAHRNLGRGRVKIVIISTRSKKMPMAAYHALAMPLQIRPRLGCMTKQSRE